MSSISATICSQSSVSLNDLVHESLRKSYSLPAPQARSQPFKPPPTSRNFGAMSLGPNPPSFRLHHSDRSLPRSRHCVQTSARSQSQHSQSQSYPLSGSACSDGSSQSSSTPLSGHEKSSISLLSQMQSIKSWLRKISQQQEAVHKLTQHHNNQIRRLHKHCEQTQGQLDKLQSDFSSKVQSINEKLHRFKEENRKLGAQLSIIVERRDSSLPVASAKRPRLSAHVPTTETTASLVVRQNRNFLTRREQTNSRQPKQAMDPLLRRSSTYVHHGNKNAIRQKLSVTEIQVSPDGQDFGPKLNQHEVASFLFDSVQDPNSLGVQDLALSSQHIVEQDDQNRMFEMLRSATHIEPQQEVLQDS